MAATRYSDDDSRETDLAAATAAIISAHWGNAASRGSGTSNGRAAGGRETEQGSPSYSPPPPYSPNGGAAYGDTTYGDTAYGDKAYGDKAYGDTAYSEATYSDTSSDTTYADTRGAAAERNGAVERGGDHGHPNGYAGRSFETPSMFLPAPPPDLAPPDFLISTPLPGQRTGSTTDKPTDTPPPRAQAAAAPVDETFAGSLMADLPFPQMPFADTSFPTFPDSQWEGSEASDGPLPHRVPAAPDVPPVPPPAHDPLHDPLEDLAAAEVADRGELSRIMTYLRDNAQAPSGKGFDVAAVLEAVRGVASVRDAQLRWSAGFGHTLRIEFQDGTDEAYVTREVVRVLRDTLGLNAAPRPAGREESTSDRSHATGAPGRSGGAPTAYSNVPYATVPFGYGPRAGYGMTPAAAAGPMSPPPMPAAAPAAAPVPVARPGEPRQFPPNSPPHSPPRSFDDVAGPGWVSLDHVQVSVLGMDATVEVRLGVSIGQLAGSYVVGVSHGPAVDAYLLRLAASAAADALDRMLVDPISGDPRGRCFVEHVGVVPFGETEVAVVVLLLVRGSVAESLSGSALVGRDPRQAVVSAMLRAVNPRLESLLVS